jgi:hypothetical protein
MCKHTIPTYSARKVQYDDQGNASDAGDVRTGMKLEEVTALTGCDPDEIVWAIEEYGKFEVMPDSDPSFDWRVEAE